MRAYSLHHLGDPELLHALTGLVARERNTTADLLAHVAEVDARRLYAPAGFASMYTYCVEELRLSEDSAYRRIRAARTARQFPATFTELAEGRLSLPEKPRIPGRGGAVRDRALRGTPGWSDRGSRTRSLEISLSEAARSQGRCGGTPGAGLRDRLLKGSHAARRCIGPGCAGRGGGCRAVQGARATRRIPTSPYPASRSRTDP